MKNDQIRNRSIYVVKSAIGPVKIGIAARPGPRFSSLQTGSPVPLSLQYVAKLSNAFLAETLETATHEALSTKRQAGEWFSATTEEAIAAILIAAKTVGCGLIPYSVESDRPNVKQRKEMRQRIRSPQHEALRQILRDRRLKAKLSQWELAERCGWAQTTVSMIECGTRRINVIELLELSDALGFDPMAAIRAVRRVEVEAYFNSSLLSASQPPPDQIQSPSRGRSILEQSCALRLAQDQKSPSDPIEASPPIAVE